MKVRAAVQTGDSVAEVMEIDMPELEPGEVLLRIEGCGMCGSDLESFRGATVDAGIATYPLVPGHEPVGRIESIDRCFCSNIIYDTDWSSRRIGTFSTV